MRTYPGWAPEKLAQFQKMMLEVFYPLSHQFLTIHNGACISNYWANWDLANLDAVLAIGVLTDREDLYKEAMDYLKTGAGNGALSQIVYYLHAGNLGQWQESGRDQGHTTLGVGLFGALAESAWNQGDDLYGYDNNRFLAGAEYIARYNLFNPVPYVTYGPNCSRAYQPVVSDGAQGHLRPVWELVYNHYVNRKGLAAPWVSQMATKMRPETGPGNGDQLGFGTLSFTRDPIAVAARPIVTARLNAGKVEISWWGSAYATSYLVKRATASSGPFTTIATVDAKADATFTDKDVKSGTTYHYVVSAVSASGAGGDSVEAVATVGPSPRLQLAFDESAGTTASDASGKGSATLVDGPVWTTGKHGNAVSFDGVDDYVRLPDDIVADLSDFTIAAWVYLDAAVVQARVFDFGVGDQRYMMLTPQSGAGVPRFAITTISGPAELAINGTKGLPVGTWVHLAVTVSGSVGILYVDGVEAGRNEAMFFTPFRLGGTKQNWIGRSQYAADRRLKGRVDDFRIYSGAMTAAEVAGLAL